MRLIFSNFTPQISSPQIFLKRIYFEPSCIANLQKKNGVSVYLYEERYYEFNLINFWLLWNLLKEAPYSKHVTHWNDVLVIVLSMWSLV